MQELRIGFIYKTSIEFKGSLEAKINYLNNNERFFILTKEILVLILQLNLEDYIKPIILTKEWLIKFGFETEEGEYGLMLKPYRFYLVWNLIGHYTLYIKGSEQTIQLSELKYVHQLQNLYFSLTGKELKLKNGFTG